MSIARFPGPAWTRRINLLACQVERRWSKLTTIIHIWPKVFLSQLRDRVIDQQLSVCIATNSVPAVSRNAFSRFLELQCKFFLQYLPQRASLPLLYLPQRTSPRDRFKASARHSFAF
jgi:hypothetical protein